MSLASTLNRLTKSLPTRESVVREIHVRQFGQTENQLFRVLRPFFRRQIADAKDKLLDLGTSIRSVKDARDEAESLRIQIYDPREWKRELIDRTFPVIARASQAAAFSTLETFGIRPTRTTASEWLENEGEELAPGLSADMPQWMENAIEIQLRETFEQPFWDRILETTGADMEEYLRVGLTEGWSIEEIARRMSNRFPSAYSRARARNVARTESGNALNGARKASLSALKEEMDGVVPMQILWLSVLGNTTREDHAANHNLPANAEGLFNLAGFMIPWPSHWSLPPDQRCNCLCSINTEFGMDDDQAQELIEQHAEALGQ